MQELTVTSAQVAQSMQHLIGTLAGGGVIQLIILLLFIGSVRKTVRPVRSAQRPVPIWLLWFLLLPVVGTFFLLIGLGPGVLIVSPVLALIVSWIMIPFAVPNALERHYADRADLVRRARNMKSVGLWCVIISTIVTVIFVLGPASVFARFQALQSGEVVTLNSQELFLKLVNAICSLAYGVLAIIYWFQIVRFRKAAHQTQTQQQHEG